MSLRAFETLSLRAESRDFLSFPKLLFFMAILVPTLLLSACFQSAQDPLWPQWKQNYLSADGRVIDTGNDRVSHSEGQGYGLLFAENAGDREAFVRIWNWTRENLQVREDQLFSWKWRPVGEAGKGVVADANNATDGDLLIAWALIRGAKRWNEPAWKTAADAVLKDVKAHCFRESEAFGCLMLPAAQGFEHETGITVNLSYWLFQAFPELAEADPAGPWNRLTQSGLLLLEKGRFGQWGLPPDWLLVNGETLTPSPLFPPEFGYNAIRIPLQTAWAGMASELLYSPYRNVSKASQESGVPIPATVNLVDNLPGKDAALPGMLAVYQLVGGAGELQLPQPAPYQAVGEGEAYYSASLGMLANLAAKGPEKNSRND